MPRWTWAGARARGAAHRRTGLPCQDAFAGTVWQPESDGGVLIAALADGAGFAECADAGAWLATAAFVGTVQSHLKSVGFSAECAGDLLRYATEEARTAVITLAALEGRPPTDFASTLVACILDANGGALAQIGDGAAVVSSLDEPDNWYAALWPDHGEFVNTTRFLTDDDAFEHLRVVTCPQPVGAICLFTDGLERLLLDFAMRRVHTPFFESILAQLGASRCEGEAGCFSQALSELLQSEKVTQRTDDDTSILCACLQGGADDVHCSAAL